MEMINARKKRRAYRSVEVTKSPKDAVDDNRIRAYEVTVFGLGHNKKPCMRGNLEAPKLYLEVTVSWTSSKNSQGY